MGSKDLLVQRANYWCLEASLGYDQANRWEIRDGGRCDCSSLGYWLLWEAGFLERPADYRSRTLYTGTIAADLVAAGWTKLAPTIPALRPCDYLLSEYHHVAVCVSGAGWGALVAEANVDERGRTTGGQPGDQTGRETRVAPVYEHSAGWDWILRPPASKTPSQGKLVVDSWDGALTIGAWQDQLGTPHDPVVSGQARDLAWRYPNLLAVTYERSGSLMVMELQRRLGIDPDGIIGYEFVGALQERLLRWGYDLGPAGVDHIWGRYVGSAVQQSINDKRWA